MEKDAESASMCDWVKAVCVHGLSPVPGTIAWSRSNLAALMLQHAVHIIDMEASLERTQEPKVVGRIDFSEVAPSTTSGSHDTVSPLDRVLLQHRTRAFVAIAWSPMGCERRGGSLLATADSAGVVAVHVIPTGSIAPNAQLLCDLTAELRACSTIRVLQWRNSGASSRESEGGTSTASLTELRLSALPEPLHATSGCSTQIAFCASPLPPASSSGTSAALLFVAHGGLVCVWRVCHEPRSLDFLLGLLVCPADAMDAHGRTCVSSLAVSSLHRAFDPSSLSSGLSLYIGTTTGVVQAWSLQLIHNVIRQGAPKQPWQMRATAAPDDVTGMVAKGDAAVTSLALAEDLFGEVWEEILAAVRGVNISVTTVRRLDSGSNGVLQHIRHFKGHAPAHGLPIVSLVADVSGALCCTGEYSADFASRVRLLTLDVTGQVAIWRLSEAPEPHIILCLAQVIVPADPFHFLTPVEQAATQLDARLLNSISKGISVRGCTNDNGGSSIGFIGLALSPSGCLLALQASGKGCRTTHQAATSYIFVAPTVTPPRAFTPLLWALCDAVRQVRSSKVFALSIWDVAEVCRARRTRCLTKLASSSEPATKHAKTGVGDDRVVLVEMLIWLVSLLPLATNGDIKQVQPPRIDQLQQFFAKWLSSLLVKFEDKVHLCQIRNALLQLGARLLPASEDGSLSLPSSRHYRREGCVVEAGVDSPQWLRDYINIEVAAPYLYWKERLHHGLLVAGTAAPSSVVCQSATLLEHLSASTCGSKQRLTAPCRLCKASAEVDEALTRISCGVHTVPICQWSLVPLLTDEHMVCGLCDRRTLCLRQSMDPSRGTAPVGVCAWCASFARVVGF